MNPKELREIANQANKDRTKKEAAAKAKEEADRNLEAAALYQSYKKDLDQRIQEEAQAGRYKATVMSTHGRAGSPVYSALFQLAQAYHKQGFHTWVTQGIETPIGSDIEAWGPYDWTKLEVSWDE